jgi:hypothetical protein
MLQRILASLLNKIVKFSGVLQAGSTVVGILCYKQLSHARNVCLGELVVKQLPAHHLNMPTDYDLGLKT